MDQLEAAAFVMIVAFAFTFGSTMRFYRGRSKMIAADQRTALRPTLTISLSFLVGAISTVFSLISLTTLPPPPATLPPASIEEFFPWVLVAEISAPFFAFALSVAVVSSLKSPRLYSLPVALLITSLALTLLSPRHPMDDPYLSLSVLASSLLMLLPIALFGFLWRKTKRAPALGMFIGLMVYYLYSLYYTLTLAEYVGYLGFYLVPSEYFGHFELYQTLVGLMPTAIFGGVLSLSLIYWFFRFSDRKIGGEIIGYSMSIPVIAWEIFQQIVHIGTVSVDESLFLLFVAVSAGVAILTGSYLYGRYGETRHKQTLALSLFSYLAGLGWILFNVYRRTPGLPLLFYGAVLVIGLTSAGFLFLSALYAMDWKSAYLLPALMIAPFPVLLIILGSLPAWLFGAMIGMFLVLTLLPAAMFAAIWKRLRSAKEKGLGRSLGIFLGLVFIIISQLFAFIPALICGIVRVAGMVVFFLAVSGRLDKLLYEGRN